MIDQELHNYASQLLKKGYTPHEIITVLKRIGHLPHVAEHATHSAFEEHHKDLLHNLRMGIAEGKDLHELKSHAIKSGAHPHHVYHAILHLKKHGSVHHKVQLSEIVSREKPWFPHWLHIYSILFLIIFSIFTIILLLTITSHSSLSLKSMETRVSECTLLNDKNFSKNSIIPLQLTCLAVISKNSDICNSIPSTYKFDSTNYALASMQCVAFSKLLLYYLSGDRTHCGSIINGNLQELCYDISDKSCSVAHKSSIYCNSIVHNSLAFCDYGHSNASNNLLVIGAGSGLSCVDNYYFYQALNPNARESDTIEFCSRLSQKVLQDMCFAIA